MVYTTEVLVTSRLGASALINEKSEVQFRARISEIPRSRVACAIEVIQKAGASELFFALRAFALGGEPVVHTTEVG